MRKDLLSVLDTTRDDLERIFRVTDKLKRRGGYNNVLKGRVIALLFEKPSTRTRISFEVGISQLGGTSIYVDASTTQLSRGETIEDTARTMERYVDAIVARVREHETLEKLARSSRIPVINALSNVEHPCQAISDYYTIRERVGELGKVTMAFIGDANNVFNSLALAGAMLGVKVRIASPKKYSPKPWLIESVRRLGGSLEVYEDPVAAVKGVDVIYTDVFVSMGEEGARDEKLSEFVPHYQVNMGLIKASGRGDVVFMHCLPAHRGEEVTSDVIESRHSIVFDQAENRLHTQKALLALMAEEGFL